MKEIQIEPLKGNVCAKKLMVVKLAATPFKNVRLVLEKVLLALDVDKRHGYQKTSKINFMKQIHTNMKKDSIKNGNPGVTK